MYIVTYMETRGAHQASSLISLSQGLSLNLVSTYHFFSQAVRPADAAILSCFCSQPPPPALASQVCGTTPDFTWVPGIGTQVLMFL